MTSPPSHDIRFGRRSYAGATGMAVPVVERLLDHHLHLPREVFVRRRGSLSEEGFMLLVI